MEAAIKDMAIREQKLEQEISRKMETIIFLRGQVRIHKENNQLIYDENQLLKWKLDLLIKNDKK